VSVAAATPILELRGIGRTYGGVIAADGVDLAIGRGELFALLGPSGCGKTTLLRIIAGLERPDHGQVLIDGVDVTAVPAYERPVNTMFQSYALFPHMSVGDNVAFGLRQMGLPKAQIAERVREMLTLVQMTGLEARRPAQLSGGQRQRVALARSLARLPALLLLDEPMAALDRKLREETRLELARIQERLGIAFVMVTHDQDEAMAMACRMAVMQRGRIVQVGPPAAVYDRPANREIAAFIGRVNLIEARPVAETAGIWQLDTPCGPVYAAADGAVPPGPVWVAVRPEEVGEGPGPDQLGVTRVSATLRQREYRGDSAMLHLELPGGGTIKVATPGKAAVPEPGTVLAVHWHARDARILTA